MIRRIEEIKLNWSNGLTAKDNNYIFTTITILPVKNNLYIRLTRYDKEKMYVVIEGYKGYTASQVLSNINWGRHFESLIRDFWKQQRLPQGSVERIVRDV